jgi:hypothetical protein
LTSFFDFSAAFAASPIVERIPRANPRTSSLPRSCPHASGVEPNLELIGTLAAAAAAWAAAAIDGICARMPPASPAPADEPAAE